LYGLTTLNLSEKWVERDGLPPAPEDPTLASTTMWSRSMPSAFYFSNGASASMAVIAIQPGDETRVAPFT